jgi:signal transduction histidine kinase
LAVGACSIVLVAAALLVAIRQYRAVMTPLDRLASSVRSFAGGKLNIRNDAVGDREFVALWRDFNRMAAELESFYAELQTKVAVQSRELARSQRLASVGFLAAGVSHEINNPLGIITGYAERMLRMLDEPMDSSDASELWSQTRRAMSIICEEAFRCKTITTRLLSMAHPGGELPGRVSLAAVARRVGSTLTGLPEYNGRRLILETPGSLSECFVRARDGEMQQMILNLTLNALQATAAPDGQVRVSVRMVEDGQHPCVELVVCDNGIGMTAETLERVFEPFYSEPGRSELGRSESGGGRAGTRGTGLGLSITHAIVTEHQGRIVAESAGPGCGSRFVVTLPAYEEQADEQNVDAISEGLHARS